MDENISDNIEAAYGLAKYYREEGDNKNAEIWALKAMELGCENKAPQLLAEIAIETKSKSTAFTLAKYYWDPERRNIDKARHWAEKAKQFGSRTEAKKFIAEIDEYCARKRVLDNEEEPAVPSSRPFKR